MNFTKKQLNDLTYELIGCAIEVHKQIGPGLPESVYEKCFLKELSLRGISFKNQLWSMIYWPNYPMNKTMCFPIVFYVSMWFKTNFA